MNNVLWSHKSCEWSTPQELFDQLDAEFHFDVDVCETDENAKCKKYYTTQDDGLSKSWVGTVWCNPPYGQYILGKPANVIGKRAIYQPATP